MKKTKAMLLKEFNNLQKEYDELKAEYDKKLSEDDDVDKNLYKEYTKKANKLTERIDYLNSAVVYLQDEENIKAEERREINKERQLVKEKSKKLNEIELQENNNETTKTNK